LFFCPASPKLQTFGKKCHRAVFSKVSLLVYAQPGEEGFKWDLHFHNPHPGQAARPFFSWLPLLYNNFYLKLFTIACCLLTAFFFFLSFFLCSWFHTQVESSKLPYSSGFDFSISEN
jgi:hypothetical protein